jgi:hypothetical protein
MKWWSAQTHGRAFLTGSNVKGELMSFYNHVDSATRCREQNAIESHYISKLDNHSTNSFAIDALKKNYW